MVWYTLKITKIPSKEILFERELNLLTAQPNPIT